MRLPSAYQGRHGGQSIWIFDWFVVSTHLKNMLVKLDHFPTGWNYSCQTLGSTSTLFGGVFFSQKKEKNNAPHWTCWFSARNSSCFIRFCKFVILFHQNFRGMRSMLKTMESRALPWPGGNTLETRGEIFPKNDEKTRIIKVKADSAKCSSIGLFLLTPSNHCWWVPKSG